MNNAHRTTRTNHSFFLRKLIPYLGLNIFLFNLKAFKFKPLQQFAPTRLLTNTNCKGQIL